MIDAERLRELLRTHDSNQSQLADELGVSPSAVHQLLSGKTKNSRLVPKIAKIFNVTEEYLNGETDVPFRPTSGTMTPAELAAALRSQLSGTTVIPANEQHWQSMNDIFDPDWIVSMVSQFDKSAIRAAPEGYAPPVKTMFQATDAMSPTILKGDDVTYSTLTTRVDVPDGLWAIDYGGLRMIRRLMPLPDGKGFRVSADNPASPTFEAPVEDIRVLGRAFWIGRSLL